MLAQDGQLAVERGEVGGQIAAVAEPGRDAQRPLLAAAADDDRDLGHRARVAGRLRQRDPLAPVGLVPGCQRARSVSMAVSSRSSLAGAGGNGRPNAACSRSHQPAPMPQNARPPLSASSVATVLARIPGARNVTGVTSVPRRRPGSRPASIPSVTQGSGIGSQARPTCGIWIR